MTWSNPVKKYSYEWLVILWKNITGWNAVDRMKKKKQHKRVKIMNYTHLIIKPSIKILFQPLIMTWIQPIFHKFLLNTNYMDQAIYEMLCLKTTTNIYWAPSMI